MESDRNRKKRMTKSAKSVKKNTFINKWVITIIIWTFILSMLISFISGILLGNVNLITAFFVLIVIVLLGVIFDIIGIAVAVANEAPFHAMATKKIPGSYESIRLIKNNDKVSSFCNDVIGDIAGIISGVATATIVIRLSSIYHSIDTIYFSLIITGIVAALTVGGKAMGKKLGIKKSKDIVLKVGYVISYKNKFIIKKETIKKS